MSCNTCTICLDSVIGVQPIGAVYPCGHVFHLECWDGWVASQRSSQTKCAMCNRQSQGFSRLFLDFVGTNDGDNVSLSSSSSCDVSSAGEQEDKDDDDDDAENESDSVDQDIILGRTAENALPVDDDDDGEPRNNSATDLPNHNVDKYKKVAKQLKQRNKYLALQIIESSKALEETRQLYQAECEERRQMERQIDSVKEDCHYTQLALSGANLEATSLKRQLAERESSLESTKATLCSLQLTLEKLQKSYDENIKKARHASMIEVQQMLIDYPKVVQENRELKSKLGALDSKKIAKASVEEIRDRPPVNSNKRKMNLLKELDQQTSTKTKSNATESRADKREAEIQLCLQKSACATVLSRTLQAKRRRSPLDVLNSSSNARHGSVPRSHTECR